MNKTIEKGKKYIIHCHHSSNPISGEMKRIININNDVVGHLSDDIIELQLYSIRDYKSVKSKWQFLLSSSVSRKYYVPNIPSLYFLNDIYRLLVMLILFIKYRPLYYVEEWSLPKGVGLLKTIFPFCKIGLDIHGAAPEEYSFLNKKESVILSRQEKYSVISADFIICQSDEMRRHLKRKYNSSLNIGVYRCGVDCDHFSYNLDQRNVIRTSLGYSKDNIVFVYSGGMHVWQKVEDSVKLFSDFHSSFPNARLLILTKEIERFQNILHKIGYNGMMSAITIKSLGFADVPKYLNAADVAFLLRDVHVMNSVASPTKLSEYMSCGLPVISTSVSERWVDAEGMKFIYKFEQYTKNSLFDFINNCSKVDISKYANEKLSLNIDRENIQEFLMKL